MSTKLFETQKMEGDWYGVFMVCKSERYLVTSTFDKKKDADYFTEAFNKLADDWKSL